MMGGWDSPGLPAQQASSLTLSRPLTCSTANSQYSGKTKEMWRGHSIMVKATDFRVPDTWIYITKIYLPSRAKLPSLSLKICIHKMGIRLASSGSHKGHQRWSAKSLALQPLILGIMALSATGGIPTVVFKVQGATARLARI